MFKSGDKVIRIHPTTPDAPINRGQTYTVNEVDKKRITLVGCDPTMWFVKEAFAETI